MAVVAVRDQRQRCHRTCYGTHAFRHRLWANETDVGHAPTRPHDAVACHVDRPRAGLRGDAPRERIVRTRKDQKALPGD
jgi:hypothetical protein